MPGQCRDDQKRLPEFYIRPEVKGRAINPDVHDALEEIWPWFWDLVGKELHDPDSAADLAEEVALRVTESAKKYPGQIRSFVAVCRVASVNFISTTKTKEGRIDYRGLSQDIEATLDPIATDWIEEVELSILIDQILRGEDTEIRSMLQSRIVGETWDEIGEALGLTAGQARLRFHRALERIGADEIFRRLERGHS